jgi:putative ABC transport system permease protein
MPHELLRRLWHAVRRRRFDADLAEEMAFHREMRERELAADGAEADEAAFAARRAFGSGALARDQARDVWVPHWLQGLGRDVSVAWRTLWSARLVSGVAIVSLALGIGANTAIFSLIDGLVLRALPVRNPQELAVLSLPAPNVGVPNRFGYRVWREMRGRPDAFPNAIVWSPVVLTTSDRGATETLAGLWTNGAFFERLGVRAVLGRVYTDADDASVETHADAQPVIVLSYACWQRRFDGAGDVVGPTLTLDGVPFTIVGVAPPRFAGVEVGSTFDVAAPMGAEPLVRRRESALQAQSLADPFRVMIRLNPGETIEAATAHLRAVQPQIRDATMPPLYPAAFRSRYLADPFTLVPASEGNWDSRRFYQRPLLAIMAIAAIVLLVACGNVANLLLARAVARAQEFSVRRALGASRWRLLRQSLVESALISTTSAALGLLAANWASHALVDQISTEARPIVLDLPFDARLAAFTVATAIGVTGLFGLLPAIRASSGLAIGALDSAVRTAASTRSRWSGVPVVAQVALSLVLVVVCGLFVRTFAALEARPLGFDPRPVLVATLNTQPTGIPPDQRASVYMRARDAVLALPGVRAAAISSLTPIVPGPMLGQPILGVSGGEVLPPRGITSTLNLISPGWFESLAMPIVAGRDFTRFDLADARAIAIVNEAFARRFLHGANAVGHTVTLALPGPPRPPAEIVGVVADAVYGSLRAPEPSTIYLPLAQFASIGSGFMATVHLSVRTERGSPAALIRSVAAAIAGVNAQMPITFHTLDDEIGESINQERVLATLSGLFGGMALLMAALGLYGVTAYAVSRRRKEIGIRMALGAAPARIVSLVLSRVTTLVGGGIVCGVALSLWAGKFVGALLYGLTPRDPATLAGAAIVLCAVAGLSAWLPARRAARVDPSSLLRYE